MAGKIVAHRFPQRLQLPACCIFRTDTDHFSNLLGVQVAAEATIEVDVLASSRKGVLLAGESLRQALQGFSGGIGTVTIDAILLQNSGDVFENPDPGESVPSIWHKTYEFTVLFQGAS